MVTATGYALDPSEGRSAVPWLQGPFELWIASPRAGRFALRLGLRGPRAGSTRYAAAYRGRGLPSVRSRGGTALCIATRLRRGRTIVQITPRFVRPHPRTFPPLRRRHIAIATQLDLRLRPTESDPIPPPPKLVALRAVEVSPGGCQ
jgi:hypothetical protein